MCRPSRADTPAVICTVPVDTDGLRIDFISWTKDGKDIPDTDDIRNISVPCTPGETFEIGVTVGFIEEVDQNTGSTQATCPGKPLKLTYFDCDTGASLLVCSLNFEGGTPPITASWNINGAERPDLLNNTVIRTGCVVGKPYRAVVTVRDRFDTLTSVQSATCTKKQQ